MTAEQCSIADSITIPKGSFIFCRYGTALLIWAAFLLKLEILVVALFVLLVLSAILTVGNAPMVWLYKMTLHRWIRSPDEVLSIAGMRVAHSTGAVFAALCLLFLYVIDESIGWKLTLMYCCVKTGSAIWACPIYKLYACMKSGNCCKFLKRKDKTEEASSD